MIQRYGLFGAYDDWKMQPDSDGEFVLFSDHVAEVERLQKELGALQKRLTPKPIRFAPKGDRLLIGVERPPLETTTFFYAIVWDKHREQFVTPFVHALVGATHFLDPRDMIGITWPYEIARQRRAALSPQEQEATHGC